MLYDITLITDPRYAHPAVTDWYIDNVLLEDQLVREALERRGLRVHRCAWDDAEMDWNSTRYVVIRAVWDYFHRRDEFTQWLLKTAEQTGFINPVSTVLWNMDKRYLRDLQERGIRIPPTVFLEPGDPRSLQEIAAATGWTEMILKPAVGGAARHTYRLTADNLAAHENLFRELIAEEAMLLQEFQHSVLETGEITYMVFGGHYSHAVLKRAKPGDFRVQDDFGGTLHEYTASETEARFAENVVKVCSPLPAYARVDCILDNQGQWCVSELELIEPELWFRRHLPSAELVADAILQEIDRREK